MGKNPQNTAILPRNGRKFNRNPYGNTAQMRLRILTDLFRQKFVCKTLKYTKYSCGFAPFSDEKSLVKLSCRFVRYCHTTKHPHKL